MKETKNREAYTNDHELLIKYIEHTTGKIGRIVEKCEILTCIGVMFCLVICAITKQLSLDNIYLGIGMVIMLITMVIGKVVVKHGFEKYRKVIRRLMVIDQMENISAKQRAMEELIQELNLK